MESSAVGSVRPGGRTARTRDAVLSAARQLLAEEGAAALRVERIAALSGINRSSIYRRWKSPVGVVEDLLADVGLALATPDTGSLGGDLSAMADALAGQLAGDGRRLVRALLAWNEPRVRMLLTRFWEERYRAVAVVLEQHGRTDIDPRTLTRLLAGPLYYRALIEDEAPGADDVEQVLALALARA